MQTSKLDQIRNNGDHLETAMNRLSMHSGAAQLSVGLVLSALAIQAAASTSIPTEACQMKYPPREARPVLEVKNTVTVVLPRELPPDFNGCQRSWLQFDGALERSIPLADTHFVEGRPVRLLLYAMDADAEIVSDCRYVNGSLDVASSVRPRGCPLASRLTDASKEKATTPVLRIH